MLFSFLGTYDLKKKCLYLNRDKYAFSFLERKKTIAKKNKKFIMPMEERSLCERKLKRCRRLY